MKLVFFAALLGITVYDLRRLHKAGGRGSTAAVYIVTAVLAAVTGYIAFYTDIRIIGILTGGVR